jgi:hypothetical protein
VGDGMFKCTAEKQCCCRQPPGGRLVISPSSGPAAHGATTTEKSAQSTKRHAPHCPPKTAVSTPLHLPLFYRLVLTRSRAAECRKANHFLAHLALLVGPEALSRPATPQTSRGRGRPPPHAPPCAAARCAAGLRPAEKLRLRRKIEGNRSPRRTALNNPARAPCRKCVRLVVG